jgi:hypothetical protein
MEKYVLRYRISLGIFIFGLAISGLTAFPLLHELRMLASLLNITDPEKYAQITGLRHWIGYVLSGLEQLHTKFPFLAYGTDWLAFAHLAIAIFFVRPLLCCLGVLPLAMIAGEIRGIPFYWRLIDCSFGVLGAVPLLYGLSLTKQMRQSAPAIIRPSA